MRVVVDHQDAARLAQLLEPTAHAAEPGERTARRREVGARPACGRKGAQRIPHVVQPGRRQRHAAQGAAVLLDGEVRRAAAHLDVDRAQEGAVARAVREHRCTRAVHDPARAIVTQAAHSDVDTIVVGTRPHPWLARRMARTVAARVVEAADRSVLVVPIEGRTALA